MERDKFMNPSEAKEFGIIDTILEHPTQEKDDNRSSPSKTDSAVDT